MNPFPDYSAAYLVMHTSSGEDRLAWFTIGRGNDLEAAAIRAFEPLVVGLDVDALLR
jgi:L-fuconate dehydratase